jgi:hypothetical protein
MFGCMRGVLKFLLWFYKSDCCFGFFLTVVVKVLFGVTVVCTLVLFQAFIALLQLVVLHLLVM